MQMTMIVTVECVNFVAILTSSTILNVIMNFMALAIISEFDDFFYSALGNDPNKEVLTDPAYEDLFTIRRTTSRYCRNPITKHILEDDTYAKSIAVENNEFVSGEEKAIPVYIYVDFWQRTLTQKLMRIIYLICRSLYVSVWFYFLPFLTLLGSYFVPYFMR